MTDLVCRKIRDLPLSALSGLVFQDGVFYVIADDQLSLGYFTLTGEFHISPLLPGDLPLEPRMRKSQKPDWECLIWIPQGLLIIPSGSKLNRCRTVLFEAASLSEQKATVLSFEKLYAEIRQRVLDLNIEGSVLRGTQILLFQRGNGAGKQNAVIVCDLALALKDDPRAVTSVVHYDLGQLHGSNLGFTDAWAGDDGEIYFLAVAESGGSTFEDGHYLGAIIGIISANGEIILKTEIQCPAKPEGLWVEKSADGASIFIVTDADDSAKMSALYQLNLSVKLIS